MRWGFAVFVIFLVVAPANGGAAHGRLQGCTTIQSGALVYWAGHYLEGQSMSTGYDAFGYNYQAHIFNGYYVNVYLGAYGFPPYAGEGAAYLDANPGAATTWFWKYYDIELVMKWNDDWLSNQDCDGNGLLDRHYGTDSYIGSGAWQTTHMSGVEPFGCQWQSNIRVVAVPVGAVRSGDVWYAADGSVIGAVVWDGDFAIVQDIWNVPCANDQQVRAFNPFR